MGKSEIWRDTKIGRGKMWWLSIFHALQDSVAYTKPRVRWHSQWFRLFLLLTVPPLFLINARHLLNYAIRLNDGITSFLTAAKLLITTEVSIRVVSNRVDCKGETHYHRQVSCRPCYIQQGGSQHKVDFELIATALMGEVPTKLLLRPRFWYFHKAAYIPIRIMGRLNVATVG